MSNIIGTPTGSSLNQIPNPGSGQSGYNVASDYGDSYSSEQKIYSGSLAVKKGQQYYERYIITRNFH